MYLVNNNYNDYYIADKTFSGGIYRTTLRAQVKSVSTTYGHGFKNIKLPYADDVYYWNKGSDSWLTWKVWSKTIRPLLRTTKNST